MDNGGIIMIEFLMSIPMWFIISITSVIVLAGIYKFIKSEKVKVGPVEFDEKDESEVIKK